MLKTLLRSVTAAALLAAPLLAPAQQLRAHLLLSARLTGDQETPAVSTQAMGVAGFTLNETRDTLFVQAAFAGLSGPITGAHIHEAGVGVAGPIITNLVPMLRGNRMSGFLTGADIGAGKLAKYLRGQYYINVHTAANPGGEIRGQIRLESETGIVTNLTGSQETPAVNTSATGLGIFTLSQNLEKLKFRVAFAGLSSAVTGAHFHTGAVGIAGPVVVNLIAYLSGGIIEGEITPTVAFLTSLSQGQVYINIHTTNNPGGEIRGQLLGEGRFLPFDARLDGTQMVPPNQATGKALAIGRLTPALDTMYLYVAHAGLTAQPTSISLYAAPAGSANTAANLLGSLPLSPANTTNIVSVSVPTATNAFINAFLRGEINVVLNTAANPNGEVRGQVLRLARDGYTIALNGAQERPNPTTSTGYGVGVVSLDRDQTNAHFMSVWGGLTGPATSGHFHTGLNTQAGPVVFNLTPYFDNATLPMGVNGFWQDNNAGQPFTARRAIQFRRDSMYMNLHTAAFPGGEIRGQVYRGARNLQRILATQPALVASEGFGTSPNPFSSSVELAFESRAVGTGQVRITDLLGRAVAAQAVAVRSGSNTLPLSLPGLAPGMYLLTLQVGDAHLTTRLLKQ